MPPLKPLPSYVSHEKLVAMCSYIDDNHKIADYLGISPKHVARVRTAMARVKDKIPDENAVSAKSKHGPAIAGNGEGVPFNPKSSAEHGSRNLLRRMLETGQHSLSKERFDAVCYQLKNPKLFPRITA